MEEETMEEQNKGKEQGKNHTAELPVAVLPGIVTSHLQASGTESSQSTSLVNEPTSIPLRTE